MKNEKDLLEEMKIRLNSVSSSMCLAKWLQVSLHLTNGKTHSCYHPPAHSIDLNEISKNPSALHNTSQKIKERAMMLKGERPQGCSYCWKIEDSKNPYSDRHYRSAEPWAREKFSDVLEKKLEKDVIPSYIEVNFNQSCQFKCSYCSPHLSTTWADEIKEYGPYPTLTPHNDIAVLKEMELWPIPINQSNPYRTAFWKWWPDIYPQLKVFRMTGGEPLIDLNTYRVLNYIKSHPNSNLELAITTNLCPPKKMMNRFQKELKTILKEKKIFRFMLFPSIDTWTKQAEYIRFGLNIHEFEKNVLLLLKEIPEILISFIITVNALSPFSLKKLLEKILEWQKIANTLGTWHRRIFFDLPYLRSPAWQAIDVLPQDLTLSYFFDCLNFMNQNKYNKNLSYGFSDFQINKMTRLIDVTKNSKLSCEQKKINCINFYRFFSEHDKRRKTDFTETFPELHDFWTNCKKLSQNHQDL
ncbi:MAG: twitch domain-containing radical SAM protein [Bdellovibrionales bacterium]|nr:twitch domain-containing radical SAM protein [Bdellovibrionales bacterium]